MKLTITRNQTLRTDRKGRSEGATFEFSCRFELDAHEREVVEKYGFSGYPVVVLKMTELRDLQQNDAVLRVDRLAEGFTFSTRYASDARHAESCITEGCASFKGVLVMVESYGGHEELEF